MAVPVFDFTDRAKPVVQMGRSARADQGNRWGEGTWGSGLWGLLDWEVIWTDLTCEVHEITTQTGRGGATDRFVPGTAAIVASNINEISEMIFPKVPETGEGIELVPQPPIQHEEELQAPDAATVVSNGWSFTDDFETRPPHWRFPAAWATTGTAPYGPFKLINEGWEPELYRGGVPTNYVGNAAAQYTQNYDPAGNSSIEVVITNVGWPTAPSSGTPELAVDLMLRTNKTDKLCDLVRFRLRPVYGGGPNQMFIDLRRMAADGSISPPLSTTPHTTNTGTNGVFGTVTLSAAITNGDQLYGSAYVGTLGVTGLSTPPPTSLTGTRIGIAVHYEQGTLDDPPGAPRIESVRLIDTVTGDDFVDDLSRHPGAGWVVPDRWRRAGYEPMHMDRGALVPDQVFNDRYNGEYAGTGFAQWSSNFDGDQFLEMEVSSISKPRPNGGVDGTALWFHAYMHSSKGDMSARVVRVAYDPGYGTSHNKIFWQIWSQGPNEESLEDLVDYAELDLGATNGVFPEPDRIRVESDLTGEVRLYRRGVLLQTVTFTDPPTGNRIGVYTSWEGDNLMQTGDRRPDVARIDQVWAGLQSPLGTEELGLWVRIGVDHDTLGQQWMFRGFVDAVVPTYIPDREDAVRIECVDSLAEAGRVFVDGEALSHPFASAPTRIFQILNGASWPAHFRTVGDDSTLMSRPSAGKAVDLLTHVAESCGGAVYGDPVTGDVVFKGENWQSDAAGGDTLAYITNYNPGADYFDVPRVCPSGWERSARRSDMCTRVRLATETSDTVDGEPIVREWRYPAGERVYGIEKYERTLLCITRERLDDLGIRQLHLRHPNVFPRIEAVALDASTADECLDLMSTATFTVPSKYRCQHRGDDGFVFDRKMLVTGVRHRMTPDRWTCRLTLDPSSPFAAVGDYWDEGRWGDAEWGRTR